MKELRSAPMRKCVGCNQSKEKATLVRLVKEEDGTIHTDPFAVKPGRGVYLCRCGECLEQALKKRAISRSLRAELTPDNQQSLIQEFQALL